MITSGWIFGIDRARGCQRSLGADNHRLAGVGALRDVLLLDQVGVVALQRGDLDVVAAATAADDRARASENSAILRVDRRDLAFDLRNLLIEALRLVFEELGRVGRLLEIAARIELEECDPSGPAPRPGPGRLACTRTPARTRSCSVPAPALGRSIVEGVSVMLSRMSSMISDSGSEDRRSVYNPCRLISSSRSGRLVTRWRIAAILRSISESLSAPMTSSGSCEDCTSIDRRRLVARGYQSALRRSTPRCPHDRDNDPPAALPGDRGKIRQETLPAARRFFHVANHQVVHGAFPK
jgi:hypothetical protein